ncbi:NAD(P)/FAD-dependent oxidoreductase [Paenibacillus abyssi]|uniref:Thioredoxin-disulfide reductase n=1 Tax=Paenibacillus abyssi TaxID=1340531 RepID=A0A917D3X0_9BACL|nr:NAD(P)/FAD-dependent oxidoreductase [Paenibacillus abyssi]GGG11378.1 thioredoxin-disulfide reductase [Paenibacillus abyssi]
MNHQYDCIIVGGGIAGLQAAIQLGRYQHRTLVLDAADGRSTLCRAYNNLLGWPEGISGQQLRESGRVHAQRLGVTFIKAKVDQARRMEQSFVLHTNEEGGFHAKRLLIATGVTDRIPGFSELKPCLGISVFICPDCDGYEVKNKRTVVIGSGKTGAEMALELTFWTSDIVYINHEQTGIVPDKLLQLRESGISYIEAPISRTIVEGDQFLGVELQDRGFIPFSHAFLAFGGNTVNTSLAEQLGVRILANRHIEVDPRTKMTNVQHVWAAGDVTAHSEQVAIAMGDGSQAAIWIHKSLL